MDDYVKQFEAAVEAKLQVKFNRKVAEIEAALDRIQNQVRELRSGAAPEPRPKAPRATKSALNGSQIDAQVLAQLNYNSPITCEKIAQIIMQPVPNISVSLRRLLHAGSIVAEGRSRGKRYSLPPSVSAVNGEAPEESQATEQ